VEDKRLAVVRLLQSYNANLPKFGVLFDKVTYDVTLKKKRFRGVAKQRRILNQISGLIVPGVCVQCRMHSSLHGVDPCSFRAQQLVAVLGSSGAGKSSLMNIISDRVRRGTIGGYVGMVCDTMRARSRADIVR